jgi:hypothetical protein
MSSSTENDLQTLRTRVDEDAWLLMEETIYCPMDVYKSSTPDWVRAAYRELANLGLAHDPDSAIHLWNSLLPYVREHAEALSMTRPILADDIVWSLEKCDDDTWLVHINDFDRGLNELDLRIPIFTDLSPILDDRHLYHIEKWFDDERLWISFSGEFHLWSILECYRLAVPRLTVSKYCRVRDAQVKTERKWDLPATWWLRKNCDWLAEMYGRTGGEITRNLIAHAEWQSKREAEEDE